jgi:hypothetical protein
MVPVGSSRAVHLEGALSQHASGCVGSDQSPRGYGWTESYIATEHERLGFTAWTRVNLFWSRHERDAVNIERNAVVEALLQMGGLPVARGFLRSLYFKPKNPDIVAHHSSSATKTSRRVSFSPSPSSICRLASALALCESCGHRRLALPAITSQYSLTPATWRSRGRWHSKHDEPTRWRNSPFRRRETPRIGAKLDGNAWVVVADRR